MNDRCPCGDPIYANTEDWETPLCYECYIRLKDAWNSQADEFNKWESLGEDEKALEDEK